MQQSQGRGKMSGARIHVRQASVWAISNGKVVSVVVDSDRDETIEAVGLRE